jgi:Tol biopolymer transport system component
MAGFYPIVYETQSVGMSSDLAVCDVSAGTAVLVPGASAPKVIETYPCWTPDGKSIVFASAPVGRHFTRTLFDLRVIPWSDGRGGVPRDVPGAAANGRSNYFPRFSPDGRWFTWVESDHESLIKASSDIYIMSADLKGPARPLACNVPHAADSWHSWSSNSRWIVFASKRDDGVFARLYLSHIDDGGHASPAVRLPIENPRIRMSFNLPEFVAHVPPIRAEALYDGVNIDAEVLRLEPPADR